MTKKLSSFNYLEGKLFARDAGAYSFYSNPLNDGESILSKMVMNNAIFSKHLFIAAYEVMDNHLKKTGANEYINILESEVTPLKLSYS